MSTDISFKVEKDTLRGTLFTPSGKGPFPAVIFFHGRQGTKERYLPIAKRLSEKGILSLAYDFRGNGESDGYFGDKTNRKGLEDARAGLEFLLGQNADKTHIGLCGASFGGYVSAMLVKDCPFVSSIILRAPAAYDNKLLDLKIVEAGVDKNFDNDSNWIYSESFVCIRNYEGKLLVIKCDQDKVIPEKIVDKYYDEAQNTSKKELKVLKDADHRLSTEESLKAFHDIILDWFLKTL